MSDDYCPHRITPEFLRRPGNVLNCEPMQPGPRCRLKTPESWNGADPLASRWLLSGGTPLILGPCQPRCKYLGSQALPRLEEVEKPE